MPCTPARTVPIVRHRQAHFKCLAPCRRNGLPLDRSTTSLPAHLVLRTTSTVGTPSSGSSGRQAAAAHALPPAGPSAHPSCGTAGGGAGLATAAAAAGHVVGVGTPSATTALLPLQLHHQLPGPQQPAAAQGAAPHVGGMLGILLRGGKAQQ